GHGTTTTAGRGGQVIHVTNLNDAGPGSLRAALITQGRRTIIFDVSGQITLLSTLCIGTPSFNNCDYSTLYGNLTVAGQTAPSPGITLVLSGPSGVTANGLDIRTDDVLIQHLRFRGMPDPSGARRDVIAVEGSRVVLDHVEMLWPSNTGKAVFISGDGGATDITVSYAIIGDLGSDAYGML